MKNMDFGSLLNLWDPWGTQGSQRGQILSSWNQKMLLIKAFMYSLMKNPLIVGFTYFLPSEEPVVKVPVQ